MAGISFSQNGVTPFQQLLGHHRNLLEKWVALEACLLSSDTFSTELKEEVRRTLAFNNGCEYCKAKGRPTENLSDPRTQLAVRIADMSGKETHMRNEEFIALEKAFTDGEISELLALICFLTACRRFGALMDLAPVCPI